MAIAIPGSKGCFSFLQHALRPGAARIKITKQVRDQLLDFLWLSEDVCNHPTHLAEVVPTPPSYVGAMDAAKAGMGGVWFPPGPAVRCPFILIKRIASKNPAFGELLFRMRFNRPSFRPQILLETSPTVT